MKPRTPEETVAWIRWFVANVQDPDDFRWLAMKEAADHIENLLKGKSCA